MEMVGLLGLKHIGNSARRFFLGLFEVQETISEQDTARGVRLYVTDGICSMAMGSLQGGPFLVAFAWSIGATNYEVGLLATIGFVSQLMQLPGLFLTKRYQRRRAINAISSGISRLFWIPIILIPFLFKEQGAGLLIQWLFLSALFAALPAPAWNSLIRDIVPSEARGRIFSRRMMLGTGLSLLLTLFAGYFVDWWKGQYPGVSLYAYSVLFLVGLLFGIVGLVALSRIPEPAVVAEEGISFRKLLAKPIKDENFRGLLIFIGVWNFAINMAVPFFVIYMLKRMNLSLAMIALLSVVSQLTHIFFLRIWGRLADRFSNKSVLSISGPLFLIAILAWSFTTMPERYFLTTPLLLFIHILSGMSLSGVTLATNNIALKLSPQAYAPSYLSLVGLVGAATGAIAPLVGGIFADFFAVRELSVTLNWSEPAQQLSIYALHLRALDFLFFFAFVVGLYSLHRLGRIREEGEVTESEVLQELVDEVVLPFRSISSVGGIRRLTYLPMFVFQTFKREPSGTKED